MRIKSSMKNTTFALLSNIITILIGLFAQAIFIKILGAEYLGINGLFNNIISMLGVVELGIGSAVIYNLYKPIAENNIEIIKSLMRFYKKAYNIITVIILIIGLAITPFLSFFVGEVTVDVNINLVYILFIIDIVASYVLSYKRAILQADQKNHIINIVHIIYLVFLNIVQIILLYYTKNYYLYLGIKIVFRLLENMIIYFVVNKRYSYLRKNDGRKLDTNIEKDIITKVKALFFHKIGSFIVSSTDNIVISKILGVLTVGLYSNYYLIISAVRNTFTQVISATTASVGNMLVVDDENKCYDIFKKMRFLNFWIATFACVCIFVIIDSFVTIWIGAEYVLAIEVVLVLNIDLYQKLMRCTYTTFKEAAGIFYEDRFIPLLESVINIVVSIVLAKIFGLVGVFIGTIVSGLTLWCYSYPKFVYKGIFKQSIKKYAKETLGYFLLFILIILVTKGISMYISVENMYINFVKNMVISLIIPNILLLAIFRNSSNFKYYKDILKSVLNNLKRKVKDKQYGGN